MRKSKRRHKKRYGSHRDRDDIDEDEDEDNDFDDFRFKSRRSNRFFKRMFKT